MTLLNQLSKGISTKNPNELMKIGFDFANTLPKDQIIGLSGILGAGKTMFVRGLASGLGITQTITSPSFNIFSIYKGKYTLVHLDAYRLNDSVENLFLDDFLVSPFLFAIEWPEKFSLLNEYSPIWHFQLSIDENSNNFSEIDNFTHSIKLLST